jgi:hypothetical protein
VTAPFVLRARNLITSTASPLVAGLTMRNNRRVAHPKRVTLTFVDLIPSPSRCWA